MDDVELKWSEEEAWKDFQYFKKKDKRKAERIKKLLKNIVEASYEGIGKPEPLRYDLTGWWSRRMDTINRVVYKVVDSKIYIFCHVDTHYTRC